MKSLIPFYVLAASTLTQAFVVPDANILSAFTSSTAGSSAHTHAVEGDASELRLVELSPFETRWLTEEQKLELKRVRLLSFIARRAC